jgi:NADH:ubiquinone oxidoreductase subunit E
MMLTGPIRAEIREAMSRYPAGRQRSAILPALYIIQREFGYCPVEAQNELATMLEIEPAEVGAVVGFYNMLHEEPKGEYHIEVCITWRRSWASNTAKRPKMASLRSTTWNVSARVPRRPWPP